MSIVRIAAPVGLRVEDRMSHLRCHMQVPDTVPGRTAYGMPGAIQGLMQGTVKVRQGMLAGDKVFACLTGGDI